MIKWSDSLVKSCSNLIENLCEHSNLGNLLVFFIHKCLVFFPSELNYLCILDRPVELLEKHQQAWLLTENIWVYIKFNVEKSSRRLTRKYVEVIQEPSVVFVHSLIQFEKHCSNTLVYFFKQICILNLIQRRLPRGL